MAGVPTQPSEVTRARRNTIARRSEPALTTKENEDG